MTTTRKAPARKTRPAPTAHVGYRPPGMNGFGNRVKEGYHAVADQNTRVGKDWAPRCPHPHRWAGTVRCPGSVACRS